MIDDWWTYRPSDFLMFSPRIYVRLFESVNAAAWPWALLLAAAGSAALARRAWSPRMVRALLGGAALAWAASGWLFQLERFAPVNWPALGFAAGFFVQALLLAAAAAVGGFVAREDGAGRRAGLALALWALLGHPLLAAAFGQPWRQAEAVGLAPDPTALATLALLLMLRAPSPAFGRLLWLLPLAWLLVSAATLATLELPQAWVLLGLLVLLAAAATRR